ncbi:MAG: GGDEF domain-containing protein [Gallionella sp.]|jgi:diguanylate cyclase (GGDEF)-like protein
MNQPPNSLIFDAIWDALNLGLILLDEQGRVKLWNDWMARHSGISAALATGHSLDTLFQNEINASFKTALKNALSHKLPIVLSNALHRSPLPLYPIPAAAQARIQQSIAITPIIDPSGAYSCLIQVTDASMSVNRERVLKLHSEKLGIDATTDSLTGAFNRRFFDERYRVEFGRAQRQGTPFSLLMLDIDFFKGYNDNYGHPAGDRVLISVVQAIKLQLNRATDVLTRYGGEEFAVILPDCGAEGAHAVAEMLRATVADLNIPHCKSKIADHITLSIGITTLAPGTKCNPTCMLETADTALYNAKHSGRNCVRYTITPECKKPCPADSLQPHMPD